VKNKQGILILQPLSEIMGGCGDKRIGNKRFSEQLKLISYGNYV